MKSVWIKFEAALALGLSNLARVVGYRLGVKLGIHPVCQIHAAIPSGPFYHVPETVVALVASRKWREEATYFGAHRVPLEDRPLDWHQNPFKGTKVKDPHLPWWKIPDFDSAVGDIKVIWEPSRFDWVLSFAQQAAGGDEQALDRLNSWLSNWLIHNPPYCGPNWKCGQEASIRVMHLAAAAILLKQVESPVAGLQKLLNIHLKRIAPTLGYAIAQDNNHGTSESAALYIGGSWLAQQGFSQGRSWQKLGVKWLENRAKRLIGQEGSFSQYSLNYHRLMLDTFSLVETWRRQLGLPVFSEQFYQRARAATNWLFHMVDHSTGDAPNLGANDGARILQLTATGYRDFRPSVQLAMAVFGSQRAYSGCGAFNLPLQWLGLSMPEAIAEPAGSRLFDDGGFAVLRTHRAMAVLRYPRFHYRPSQADALHVDLWLDGQNLLRDAGTYSYNTTAEWLDYFPGTKSHNTAEFDGRDQMPRLSRFLFGCWLKTRKLQSIFQEENSRQVSASYSDAQGASHERQVILTDIGLRVSDELKGFAEKAVLRWRLMPGDWQIKEDCCISNGEHRLAICGNVSIARFELTKGWESRYYLEKTMAPVLEIEIHQPGTIETEYCWEL